MGRASCCALQASKHIQAPLPDIGDWILNLVDTSNSQFGLWCLDVLRQEQAEKRNKVRVAPDPTPLNEVVIPTKCNS